MSSVMFHERPQMHKTPSRTYNLIRKIHIYKTMRKQVSTLQSCIIFAVWEWQLSVPQWSLWLYPSWYPSRGWEWFRQGENGESFKHTEYNKSAFILFEHVHKLSSESILKFSFLLEEYLTVLLFLFFSFCPKYAWQNPTNNNIIILYFSIVVLSCQNHSTRWLMDLHSCHCESGNNESYYL